MSGPKREKLFSCDNDDTEIVCLSSDEEVDAKEGVKNGASFIKKGHDQPRTLIDMGFKAQQESSALRNGYTSGRSSSVITSSAEVKHSRTINGSSGGEAADVEILTLCDDSEGFEIEYPRKSYDLSGDPQEIMDVGDSDDDIQVLEDTGCSFRTKKRPSQESGTKEVNLSLPGLNLGLISGGSSRISNQNKTVFIDGNEESSSQEVMGLVDPIDDEIEVLPDEPTDSNSDAGCRPFQNIGCAKKVDYVEETRRALQRFINEFCARKHRGVKKSKLDKVKQKVWDAFAAIEHFHEPIHNRVKEEIESATEVIRCTADLHWKTLRNLLDIMSPKVVVTLDDKPEDERKKVKEQKKMELRHRYEQELAKMQRNIRKLEEAEVDWDDEENEHNSPYIMADKYKAKLIKAYYTLCDLSSCNRLTGRPTQTKINLKRHNGGTNYEKIDAAVEKFINKGGFLFAPDYTDILEIITKVNEREGLGFSQHDIQKTAQQMFENVMKIIKKRREKDFKISMLTLLPKPGSSGPPPESGEPSTSPPTAPIEENEDTENFMERFDDPAELDEELRVKLEENDKLKKSEAEVIDRFCKLAEESGYHAKEVNDDNANGSPPPSDNEEDDYDDEEEDVKIGNEHELAELTEDEDEEPETVTSGWNGPLLPEDSDEDSNEGKTTESDSEANLDTAEDSNSNNAVDSDAKSQALVESEVKTVVNDMVKETEEKDDDEVLPPPAKRMRPDENFNEDSSLIVEDPKPFEVSAEKSSEESSK